MCLYFLCIGVYVQIRLICHVLEGTPFFKADYIVTLHHPSGTVQIPSKSTQVTMVDEANNGNEYLTEKKTSDKSTANNSILVYCK